MEKYSFRGRQQTIEDEIFNRIFLANILTRTRRSDRLCVLNGPGGVWWHFSLVSVCGCRDVPLAQMITRNEEPSRRRQLFKEGDCAQRGNVGRSAFSLLLSYFFATGVGPSGKFFSWRPSFL
jgi:hypothetical protein